jgi:ABC-type transport system involved in multi-copper enzyme maturation permease subunit
MIRFTSLQFRIQAAIAVGVLVLVAIVVAITGPNLVHLYDTTVANCKAHGDCSYASNALTQSDSFLQSAFGALLLVLPALVGIFWGAPLIAREFEAGTFRLAWTQSVTRMRWLAVKLGIIGLASMVAAGLASLMVSSWFGPIDKVTKVQFASFDERGIVAIGYAVFAFAFGVAAGLLIRRTVPAMFATLVAFIGARLAVTYWVRPHLLAPVKAAMPLHIVFGTSIEQGSSTGLSFFEPVNIPNAWIYSNEVVNNSGHAPTAQFLQSACHSALSGPASGAVQGVPTPNQNAQTAFAQCFANVAAKFHQLVIYQPASRYWAFQWYETAIFFGLAVIVAGFSFWWVRRRLV